MSKLIGQILLAIVLATSLTTPAAAHHSYAAFDMTKTKELSGSLVKFDWTNPHAFVYVAVGADQYKIETTSPVMLSRRGFKRDMMKPGDKVKVTINPHRTKPNEGSLVSLTLPDGRTFTVGGGQRPSEG